MNNKNNEECVWIGIGINIAPTDTEYSELLKFNTFLVEKYGSSFAFDPKTNQPHINLYDLDVPKSNLQDIETALAKVAKNFKRFIVELGVLDYFKQGTIFINCKTNDQLEELEKKVVENIMQYKGSCRTEDYWQPWREYNKQQVVNREKYGNPHVLDTFTPHITVGFIKVNEDRLQEVVEQANQKSSTKEITCDHIDLVVHDQEGELVYSKRFLFL